MYTFHIPVLTLSTLGKIFSRQLIETCFVIFPRKQIWHFMQIVSYGNNLHEMSNLFSGKNKKNTINLLSAEYAQRVLMVKVISSVMIVPLRSVFFT